MRAKTCSILGIAAILVSLNVFAQQTVKITSSHIGYLEYLPQGYNSNSNLYPLVISLHGIDERGTTSTDPAAIKSSVPKVANVSLAKYVKYGAQYPFILISPQLKSSYGTWPADYVMDVVNYVRQTLRVDPKRIYITGLSLGGFGTWTTIGAYPGVFAAAVPICSGGNALSKACAIAAENVAVWAFHGDKDPIVSYAVTTKMVSAINACASKPNPLAKATLFAGMNHFIWDKVYKETNALAWMLSYVNGTAPSTGNLPPLVNAGVDLVEYVPASSAVCNGSATDRDGTISAYAWTQVSGPSLATLENKTTKSLKASNLKAGTYTFRLKATDDRGAYANDDVKVIISSTTSVPTVSAGGDRSITLPTNSLYLQGTASDADGIASYVWTKISGGSASLSGQSTSKLRAYNLLAGTYVFRLTVKDTKGNSKYDDVKVSVLASSATSNAAPVANAGPNKTLVLPSSSVKLNGSAKDSDGTIKSYKWTQYGGVAATLTYATSPTVTISGLKEGSYYFRLTVTDNDGATDYDNTLVKVTADGVTAITLDPAPESLLAVVK
jgi:poly(3-hydroxybutyrate) depolymerase